MHKSVSTRPQFIASRGFSLVELMLAMAVGALLLLGLAQLFIANQKNTASQQALTVLQDSARFAGFQLKKDIRSAGYTGCQGAAADSESFNNSLDEPDKFWHAYGVAVQGWDHTGGAGATSPDIPNDIKNRADSSSDILVLRSPQRYSTQLSEDMSSSEDSILKVRSLDDNEGQELEAHDLVLISSCYRGASLLAVKSANDTTINKGDVDLGRSFKEGAQVDQVGTVIYYVEQGALYRQVGKQKPKAPYLEGVDVMRVRYNQGDEYVQATAVTDWSEVRSVRVALLVNSIDPIAKGDIVFDTQKTIFDSEFVIPKDKQNRLRLLYETTVAIRNRVH